MRPVIAIALGGAAGALARYGIDVHMLRRLQSVPGDFPWGTLAVNVLGSFLLGILFVVLIEPATGPPWLRQMLTVGFLSSFTTFSTFSVQAVSLAEAGRLGLAVTYVFTSVFVCIFAASFAILASRVSHVFGWIGALVVTVTVVIALTRRT